MIYISSFWCHLLPDTIINHSQCSVLSNHILKGHIALLVKRKYIFVSPSPFLTDSTDYFGHILNSYLQKKRQYGIQQQMLRDIKMSSPPMAQVIRRGKTMITSQHEKRNPALVGASYKVARNNLKPCQNCLKYNIFNDSSLKRQNILPGNEFRSQRSTGTRRPTEKRRFQLWS